MMRSRTALFVWRWLAAALVCACVLRLRVRVSRDTLADYPRVPPARLAHYLADFSHHTQLFSHKIEDWELVQERNNYSSWEYDVKYRCGARCEGRAGVAHHQGALHQGALHQGADHRRRTADPAHALTFTHTYCSSVPLLLWITFCDEITVKANVEGVDEGSRYRESAQAHCGVWSWASGACADSLTHRQRQLLRLASNNHPQLL